MKTPLIAWMTFGGAVLAAAMAGCGAGSSPIGPDGHAPEPADTAAPGTGDAAKSDGGGGEAGGGLCGDHMTFLPRMSVGTWGPMDASIYDGPAVVERSTNGELVLAYSLAGSSLPAHVSVGGVTDLPLFPPGAKVWLYKSPAGAEAFQLFGPSKPWTFALRDKKGGKLLLGAGREPMGAALIPFSVHAGGDCTTPYADECAHGTAVYSTLDVQGDSTVAIADNETRAVRVGGVEYDVRVMARKIDVTMVGCGDYFPNDGVSMDVRAKDAAALIASLEVGPQLACARGNDVVQEAYFVFYDVDGDIDYDGQAFYTKRGDHDQRADCYQFSVVGVTGATPTAKPAVEFCAPKGLMPEPTVGQEFWVTTSSFTMGALHGPNRGPLLVAGVFAAAPFDDYTRGLVAKVLGVPADTRAACTTYSEDRRTLWQLAIGATAPGLIKTDAHTVVPIAGKNYDAWMSDGNGALYFSLVVR